MQATHTVHRGSKRHSRNTVQTLALMESQPRSPMHSPDSMPLNPPAPALRVNLGPVQDALQDLAQNFLTEDSDS